MRKTSTSLTPPKRMQTERRLLLFDIDGTLIESMRRLGYAHEGEVGARDFGGTGEEGEKEEGHAGGPMQTTCQKGGKRTVRERLGADRDGGVAVEPAHGDRSRWTSRVIPARKSPSATKSSVTMRMR